MRSLLSCPRKSRRIIIPVVTFQTYTLTCLSHTLLPSDKLEEKTRKEIRASFPFISSLITAGETIVHYTQSVTTQHRHTLIHSHLSRSLSTRSAQAQRLARGCRHHPTDDSLLPVVLSAIGAIYPHPRCQARQSDAPGPLAATCRPFLPSELADSSFRLSRGGSL